MADIWLIIRAPAKDNSPPFYFLTHGRNFIKFKSKPGFLTLGYHREGKESAREIVRNLNRTMKN